MKQASFKTAFLAFILASALPLGACGHSVVDTPTSPTQAGPTVSTTPTPEPTPNPIPTPTPTPTPQPPSDQPSASLTGTVANLARGGAGDLDISFRINDNTIVRATADTPVVSGGQTFRTDAVRNGQTVMAEGKSANGFLDATRITILAQAP